MRVTSSPSSAAAWHTAPRARKRVGCRSSRPISSEEIGPTLERLGFRWRLIDNPVSGFGPILIGERHEDKRLPTVLSYGHGDVDPRLRGAMARGALAVGHRGRGRALVRARHRRQQGPAHDQPRRPRARARGARPARLQRQAHPRDRRGDRLAGPARGVRALPRRARGRRASSPPTGRACAPLSRPFSSARAAPSTSTSP